jgi:hypothetical protein
MNGVMAYQMLRARLLVVLLVILTTTVVCNKDTAGRLPVYPVKERYR